MNSQEIRYEESIVPYIKKDPLYFFEDATVADAIAQLRSSTKDGGIAYFYVVDRQNRLVGVIPVRRLLRSSEETRLEAIMERHPITLSLEATVRDACELFLKHRFLALPVVDRDGKLEGTIDITLFSSELSGIIKRHDIETAFQLIGVHALLGRHVSPWKSFLDRAPWLSCNIACGLACAFLVSRFEHLVRQIPIIAMFMTLVLALGESVSMQSMTLTLQSLFGLKRVKWRHFNMVRKELWTSLLLGGACALLVSTIAFFWHGSFSQSLFIGASILAAMMTACLLGVLLPLVIKILALDPRIAAGPLVLAITDLSTLAYYFNFARVLLHHWA